MIHLALALWLACLGGPAVAASPDPEAAVEAVEALLGAVRSGSADPEWLRERVRPQGLPAEPGDAWYHRLFNALAPGGALGHALRRSPGVVSFTQGPDYVRVVLGGEPLLSAIVRGEGDEVRIDRFEVTTCAVCEEPARFVRDLLADVEQRGARARRLLPGVELDMSEAPSRADAHWIAALEAWHQRDGELARLLPGAEVVEAADDQVVVRYADGQQESWALTYRDGHWMVRYGSLADDSPLRLSDAALRSWRDGRTRAQDALQRWEPRWSSLEDGVGLEVGHRAVGAAFDPLDGTVLIAAMDMDRVLAAVFRVDPATSQVVERHPLPTIGARTPLPLGSWFERWHMALSPDGREVAVSAPGRIWRLDLRSGRVTLGAPVRKASALAFGNTPDAAGRLPLIWGEDEHVILAREGAWTRYPLAASPLVVATRGSELFLVTTDGAVGRVGPDQEPRWAATCCGEARDAAVRADGSAVLVACAPGCDALAWRVDGPALHPRPLTGAGSAGAGVSFSPGGHFFTTPAPDGQGLLLWSAAEDRPVAELRRPGVRQVSWSPDGASLLTLSADGHVHLWDVHRLRQRRGL